MSNILIIGANGGIGRQTVDLALSEGHRVTAVVRNPAKLPLTHPNLKIVRADVTQPLSLSNLFAGHDAIISTIGVSGGFKDPPTNLYSQGALNILREMKQSGRDVLSLFLHLLSKQIHCFRFLSGWFRNILFKNSCQICMLIFG